MKAEIKNRIETLVKTGLFNEGQIKARIQRLYFRDSALNSAEMMSVEMAIHDIYSALILELDQSRGAKGSVENLYAAGEVLQSKGIMFVPNIADTVSEIPVQIKANRKEFPDDWTALHGYCAFSLYDVCECLENSKLYLTCQSLSNKDSDTTKVFRMAVEIFNRAKFNCLWSGSISERITIDPFKWSLSR